MYSSREDKRERRPQPSPFNHHSPIPGSKSDGARCPTSPHVLQGVIGLCKTDALPPAAHMPTLQGKGRTPYKGGEVWLRPGSCIPPSLSWAWPSSWCSVGLTGLQGLSEARGQFEQRYHAYHCGGDACQLQIDKLVPYRLQDRQQPGDGRYYVQYGIVK